MVGSLGSMITGASVPAPLFESKPMFLYIRSGYSRNNYPATATPATMALTMKIASFAIMAFLENDN